MLSTQLANSCNFVGICIFSAVLRIIKYLLGTFSRGLFFRAGASTQLQAYSDSDWAGCPDTQKSTTCWCIFLGEDPISWKCKKQDSEYRTMSAAFSEIIWLRSLLSKLGFSQAKPIPLHADNTSVIQIVTNLVYHERTKHIEVDCHSIREAMIIELSPYLMFLHLFNSLKFSQNP